MRYVCLLIVSIYVCAMSYGAEPMKPEDYYVAAHNEIVAMLTGRDTLSVKRAVYLAEWAYYEGKLDYSKDFCDEIDRIAKYIIRFYKANKFDKYKTGLQMALNEYFFRPYSGNRYKPYVYDFESFAEHRSDFENQFVSKVLKTQRGQCRSLPWTYKILANEIGADVSIAHAPKHCYIMYRDKDNFTPEEWINLELTTHQMVPAFSIKDNFEICDSAVAVGTYMTPLTEVETVACQLADIALSYCTKFNRCDRFSLHCATSSLIYYKKNPTALIIRGRSLYLMLQNHLIRNGYVADKEAMRLDALIAEIGDMLYKTYMTEETDEMLERRKRQAVEAQTYTEQHILSR